MDITSLTKIFAALASAFAGWLGYKKFKSVVDTAQTLQGPRDAAPDVKLVYSWGPTAFSGRQLKLSIGNKENRRIIIYKFEWQTYDGRLKWDAEPVSEITNRELVQGEGLDVIFDPDRVIDGISFRSWIDKVSIIMRLRLVTLLRSGENIPLRLPSYLRSHLAATSNIGPIGRSIVFVHHRIWP